MNAYLAQIKQALQGRNGPLLESLMALPVSLQLSAEDKSLANSIRTETDLNRVVHKALRVDQAISDFVSSRLQALGSLIDSNYDDAYKHTHAAFNIMLDFMGSNVDFPFFVATLARLSGDLRVLALRADGQKSARERMSSPSLRDCQNSITRAFTLVAKDRSPVTDPNCKKLFIFNITNTLFKIYFKLNTLQLMGKLIRLVDQPAVMNSLQAFPLRDVVTYKYYVGRLALFEDRLADAQASLKFALDHTPVQFLHNRKLILASLVPIQMCCGIMPTSKVAAEYGLTMYLPLAQAVVCGNLRDFNRVFEENKADLIRNGTYLVIEQLKAMVYRNLFKRIHHLSQSTRLNLGHFQVAITWLGEKMSLEEIECILANLIFQNKVKGYISHQKRILVVGKTEPFPSSALKRMRI